MSSSNPIPISQPQPNQEEIISEIRSFLQNNPPKHRLSQSQIDELLLANCEIYLEIKRERKARKNKNFISSNLINLVSKYEKNLIKLSRSIPIGQSYDSEIFEAAKNYYQGLHKRKNFLPQSQTIRTPNVPTGNQMKPNYSKNMNPANYEHHYPQNPNVTNVMMRNNINYPEYQQQNQGKFMPNQGFHQNASSILKQGYINFNNNQDFQGVNMNMNNMNNINPMNNMNPMSNLTIGNMGNMNAMNMNTMNSLGNMGNAGNMGGIVNNMNNLSSINNTNSLNNLSNLNNMSHINMNNYNNNNNNNAMHNSGFNNNLQMPQMPNYGTMNYDSYQNMLGESNNKEDLLRKEDK